MVPAPLSMLATRDEPWVNLRARERVPSLTDRRVFVRSYLESRVLGNLAACSRTRCAEMQLLFFVAPCCGHYVLLRHIFKSRFTID